MALQPGQGPGSLGPDPESATVLRRIVFLVHISSLSLIEGHGFYHYAKKKGKSR